tara:strand:+ start:4027 stop:4539 length:513 start_codon:yes stop_codon:yes gene_type:complete
MNQKKMQIQKINRQNRTELVNGDKKMSKTIRYGKGRGSVEILGKDRDMFYQIIKDADPIIVRVLEETTERLAKQSEQQWFIRQAKYGESKGSKYMHRTGIRIIPPNTIEAFVENTAPYAWAIRVGRESSTNIRQGKRLADAVLWSPAKASVDKILKEIAEKTVKRIAGMK